MLWTNFWVRGLCEEHGIWRRSSVYPMLPHNPLSSDSRILFCSPAWDTMAYALNFICPEILSKHHSIPATMGWLGVLYSSTKAIVLPEDWGSRGQDCVIVVYLTVEKGYFSCGKCLLWCSVLVMLTFWPLSATAFITAATLNNSGSSSEMLLRSKV